MVHLTISRNYWLLHIISDLCVLCIHILTQMTKERAVLQ